MLIFKDLYTDNEVLSDAFSILDESSKPVAFEGKTHEQIDAAILKVPSHKVTPNADGDVDIGCGNSFGGTNEDEEADAGGNDPDAPQPVIDIVHYFQLQNVPVSKGVWKTYFMAWCKATKDKLVALDASNGTKLADQFKKNFPALKTWGLTTVYNDIDNYEFYIPKTSNFPADNETLLIPAKYEGEATSPDFYFMLDGLVLEKC